MQIKEGTPSSEGPRASSTSPSGAPSAGNVPSPGGAGSRSTSAQGGPGPSTTPLPYAVEVRGLSRRYGPSWALVELNLQVPRGETLLVAGHNGSGKSTLLRLIAGALRPSAGEIFVEGFADPAERRRRTGLLTHSSFTYEPLTAMQNLKLFAELLGRPATPERLLPLLERVGLAARADDPVAEFSAGMHKRLALARLFLQEPSVVLLDEPYGQLDPQGFRLVDALLEELRERKATVLIASHLLERGAALCSRAVLLERGRLAWDGPARELLQQTGIEPAARKAPDTASA